MAIIDPDGLFNGDRMRKLSVMARLYWPYFLLASNGYGRLEINYHRIAGIAFRTFDPAPPEPEVNAYLKEYAHANLLFLYMRGGEMWGQFDVPERLLDKYKKASCKRSPEPPEKEYSEWKDKYQAEKKALAGIAETLPESYLKVAKVFVQISPLGIEKENVNVKEKEKKQKPAPLALPAWLPSLQWKAFLEIRAKKRIPNTDYALKLVIGKLEDYRNKGHPPEKVLDLAIEKGWTTVWEPKENVNGQQSKNVQRADKNDEILDRYFKTPAEGNS